MLLQSILRNKLIDIYKRKFLIGSLHIQIGFVNATVLNKKNDMSRLLNLSVTTKGQSMSVLNIIKSEIELPADPPTTVKLSCDIINSHKNIQSGIYYNVNEAKLISFNPKLKTQSITAIIRNLTDCANFSLLAVPHPQFNISEMSIQFFNATKQSLFLKMTKYFKLDLVDNKKFSNFIKKIKIYSMLIILKKEKLLTILKNIYINKMIMIKTKGKLTDLFTIAAKILQKT